MAGIIQIGKRQWVAGMTWRSYEDTPEKADLAEDAEMLRAQWVSVRNGKDAIQGGFCAPIDGFQKPVNMSSLAAMLADSKKQPWLGIFKISEGLWWYIAVRDNNAILPDGDVLGGKEAIEAARQRHSGHAAWEYVEGDLEFLSNLIDQIDERLTPVKLLGAGLLPDISVSGLVAIAAVTVCALGGGWWWWQQQEMEAAREKARQVQMAEMRKQLLAGKAMAAAPTSPMATTPAPNDWLSACAAAWHPFEISDMGWFLDKRSCTSTSAVVERAWAEGATADFLPAGGRLSPDGKVVTQTIALEGLVASGASPAIPLRDAEIAMRAWAQTANFTLVLGTKKAEAAPALPGAEQAQAAVAAPTISSTSVTLDILVTPFDLDFSAIPGLRLNTLHSTPQGWHLEGALYGQ